MADLCNEARFIIGKAIHSPTVFSKQIAFTQDSAYTVEQTAQTPRKSNSKGKVPFVKIDWYYRVCMFLFAYVCFVCECVYACVHASMCDKQHRKFVCYK